MKTSESNPPQGHLRTDSPTSKAFRGDDSLSFPARPDDLADNPFKGSLVPPQSIEFNDSFSSPLGDLRHPELRDDFSSPPDPIIVLQENLEYLRMSGLGDEAEISAAKEALEAAREKNDRERPHHRFRETTELDAGPCGDVVK
jgi:hypothetical protein